MSVRKFYNGLGQLIQSQTAGATLADGACNDAQHSPDVCDIVVDTQYDAAGRAVRQSVPYTTTLNGGFRAQTFSQPASRTAYDALGRTTIITGTDGATSKTFYLFLETRTQDARGNQTRTLYDRRGRVSQVIPLNGSDVNSPIGPSVTYLYTETLKQQTAALRGGVKVVQEFDYAGRQTQMVDPDLGTWNYAYDALGNRTRQTDAKAQTICMYYDSLNRLKGKNYRSDTSCPGDSGSYSLSYSYDSTTGGNYGIGQRTGMVDGSGSTSWKYDSRGRLVQESKVVSGSGTFVTQYGYNRADQPAWMKYPADNAGNVGEQVTYGYNSQGTLNSLYSSTNSYFYVAQTIYDAAGRVDQRWLGAANLGSQPVVVSDYDYHPWSVQGGALRNLKAGSYTDRTSLQSFEYNYDAMGNLNWIKDYKAGGIQTQSFTYDNLNRLLSAGASGGTWGTYAESYSYSATSGNLASKGSSSYSYGAQSGTCPDGALSKAHAVVTAGSNSYCYDLNGNMVKRTVSGQSYTLAYNAENQMSGVSGAASAAFVYDGSGVRVKGTAGGVTTVYIGNYFEWTGSTSTLVKYYYAGAVRVAMRSGSSAEQTTGLNFLLGDHLSSTNRMVDPNGVAQAELRYRGWGETRYAYGTMGTTFQYTGQRNQAEIGLYYYGARWYDSGLGRFTSADTVIPAGVQGLDRYGGMYNNPVRYRDPSGHNPQCGPDGIYCDNSISWQEKYGLTLDGDWNTRDILAIKSAVKSAGKAIGLALGMKVNPAAAFTAIFGSVTITKGLQNANYYCTKNMGSAGGCTSSAHQINFASLQQETVSGGGVIPENIAFMAARNNVVHELGHAFADLWYRNNGTYDYSGPHGQIPDNLRNESGFAPLPADVIPGSVLIWRQHPNDTSPQEIFADMFLGWTFDTWASNNIGIERSTFMNTNMAAWIR